MYKNAKNGRQPQTNKIGRYGTRLSKFQMLQFFSILESFTQSLTEIIVDFLMARPYSYTTKDLTVLRNQIKEVFHVQRQNHGLQRLRTRIHFYRQRAGVFC